MLKKLLLNSSFLSFIKVITTAVGMVQSIILAHTLSTNDYALFSQSSVLIGTIGGITAFGFADAIIYFSGISKEDNQKRQSFVSTIFLLECIFCFAAGLIVFFLKKPIGQLFNNSKLSSVIFLISFFPLLVNASNCLNQLLFTEKKIKSIGIGNLFFSSFSLAIVLLAVNYSSPVFLYLVLEIVFYLIYIVYLVFCYLREKKRFVRLVGISKKSIKVVLSYAIPLGVAIFSTTLLKELDKIIISNQCSTFDYATYAAVSKQLPVTFFSAALAAQLVPALASCRGTGNKKGMIQSLRIYYLFGFVSALVLGLGVFSVSRQSLIFLYSEKYVGGIWVFIIYILVDIVSFAYPGMLLTISGRSKELLVHSLIMLIINVGLNIVFLKLFGIIGPALATLIVQMGGLIVQTFRGLKINSLFVSDCIPFKDILSCIIICLPATVVFSKLAIDYPIHYILDIFIYGGPCVLVNLILCFAFMKKRINSFNYSEDVAI